MEAEAPGLSTLHRRPFAAPRSVHFPVSLHCYKRVMTFIDKGLKTLLVIFEGDVLKSVGVCQILTTQKS